MCKGKMVVALMTAIMGIYGSQGMGDNITFQDGLNGYQGTADTYLNGYAGGGWDTLRNYGASTELQVMGAALADGGYRTGTLIRFDNMFGSGSNQIPSTGSTITHATLRLYCTAEPEGDAYTTDTFLMTTPWIEGTKNGDYATGGEVTYLYKGWEDNGGQVIAYWGNLSQAEKGPQPGIDYDGTRNVWKTGAEITVNNWAEFDITPYVQLWKAGTANNGVYITEVSSYWNGAKFVSSDGAADYRPQLVVEYIFVSMQVPVQARLSLDNYSGNAASMAAKFEFQPVGNGTPLDPIIVLPDNYGFYNLGNIPQGNYSVTVKTFGHLKKVVTGVYVFNSPTVLGPISLIGGDCDGDNEVTSNDLSIVLAGMDLTGDL